MKASPKVSQMETHPDGKVHFVGTHQMKSNRHAEGYGSGPQGYRTGVAEINGRCFKTRRLEGCTHFHGVVPSRSVNMPLRGAD